MEIRIRTHEELRTDRVTIEITGTGAEVAEDWETKLYTDDELTQAIGRESDPLRRRIAELERTLAGAIDREAKVDKALVVAENKVRELEEKVRGYDTDRHTERDRADRERQRASELKDRLSSSEDLVQGLENQVAALTRRIDNTRAILSDRQVTGALNRAVRDQHESGLMAQAIEKALEALA